ncbi:MAG: NUDIX hydrolase [Anaerolineales bacterium]|nr:NUDIX hydrolase [Anaerolineales bacterium]
MPSFEFLRSEVLMKGRAFTIRRDYLKTPDGRETKFDIVEHGGSVVIVPVDAEGNLLFVRQYRHAANMDMLELPAGTRDGDEPFEECAAREIREETGMAARALKHVGSFYLAPGYSTEDLEHDPLEADDDEFLAVEKIPIKEALAMAERGEIPDAKSLAALLMARPFLENQQSLPIYAPHKDR